MTTLHKHRFAFIVGGLVAAVGAIAPLFLIAGCRTLQQTPQELQARETLRAMTRGGVLPAEDAVARIESDFPKTTAGARAQNSHARDKNKTKEVVRPPPPAAALWLCSYPGASVFVLSVESR